MIAQAATDGVVWQVSPVLINQALVVLAVVGISGGIGGLCAGFSHREQNVLVLPFTGRGITMGFVGDILIGQVSALAGFLLLSLGEYEVKSFITDVDKLMKFASLCIVAGFTGLRLMRSLSQGILKKVEMQQEKMESVEKEVEVSRKVNALLIEAAYMRVKGKYLEESRFCEEALKLDPNNEEALIGLAVSRSLTEEPANFVSAASTLKHVIDKVNPESARAHYNLACLGNLMEEKYPELFPDDPLRGQVWHHLGMAIRYSAAYRTYALDDPDFANLRADPKFKHLVS